MPSEVQQVGVLATGIKERIGENGASISLTRAVSLGESADGPIISPQPALSLVRVGRLLGSQIGAVVVQRQPAHLAREVDPVEAVDDFVVFKLVLVGAIALDHPGQPGRKRIRNALGRLVPGNVINGVIERLTARWLVGLKQPGVVAAILGEDNDAFEVAGVLGDPIGIPGRRAMVA